MTSVIRNIASSIKKKLDHKERANSLMESQRPKEIISAASAEGGGDKQHKVRDEFSEVYIEALKPGLVIGKHGSNLKSIAIETAGRRRCSGPRPWQRHPRKGKAADVQRGGLQEEVPCRAWAST
jgi:predicted metal-dependent RNase